MHTNIKTKKQSKLNSFFGNQIDSDSTLGNSVNTQVFEPASNELNPVNSSTRPLPLQLSLLLKRTTRPEGSLEDNIIEPPLKQQKLTLKQRCLSTRTPENPSISVGHALFFSPPKPDENWLKRVKYQLKRFSDIPKENAYISLTDLTKQWVATGEKACKNQHKASEPLKHNTSIVELLRSV